VQATGGIGIFLALARRKGRDDIGKDETVMKWRGEGSSTAVNRSIAGSGPRNPRGGDVAVINRKKAEL